MPEQVTRTRSTQGARSIAGFMFVAVTFSLIGKTASNVSNPAKAALSDGQIILGGGVAAVVLTIMAKAGETGREFAVGLALVVLASSAFVYGGPVWALITRLLGQGHPPTGGTLGTGARGQPVAIAPSLQSQLVAQGRAANAAGDTAGFWNAFSGLASSYAPGQNPYLTTGAPA